jgi:hypothetical protein
MVLLYCEKGDGGADGIGIFIGTVGGADDDNCVIFCEFCKFSKSGYIL